MLAGKGLVVNGIFYSNNKETTSGLPSSSVPAGVPGHPVGGGKVSGTALTGVYTATGTPSPSSAASDLRPLMPLDVRIAPLGVVVFAFAFGALFVL